MLRLKPAVWLLVPWIVASAPAATSALWGTNGESWQAGGRLPDFSYAGYHCGEKPLPDVPAGVSVKNFGARGDGVTDDTAAFLMALAGAKGAVEVPPGRYLIRSLLEINRSGVVLRGAGPDKTTLFFARPLQAIKPDWSATTTGKKTSAYSWSGGSIWFRGRRIEQPLADIVAEAKRGEQTLTVSTTKDIRVGQRVEIFQRDNQDNSLAVELYSGDAGNITNLLGSTHASIVCRITRIDGDRIEFDRPLRFAVKTQWHPQVRRYAPTVTESGVENLRLEFPGMPYPGHFNEQGYNGVAFTDVADCWARHLVITNADSGVFPDARFCTIDDVTFDNGRAADEASHCTGHHGTDILGEDNLITGFNYRAKFIHDISVEHCAAGNVIANGRGIDLCLDHHVCAPYENLFTDIDAGAGTRLWFCGGGSALGKHAGARETFWNIRTVAAQKLPPPEFGPPSMNFVALHSTLPSRTDPSNGWYEAVLPKDIEPADLHAAQLARRLTSP